MAGTLTSSRLIAAALVLALASCSGDAGSTTTDSVAIVGVADTAAPTATIPASDTTATTDTTVTSDPTEPSGERQPLRAATALTAGAYTSTELVGPGLAVDLDLPIDGLVAVDEEGAIIINEGDYAYSLVSIVHLDNAVAFEPTVDAAELASTKYRESVSRRTPSDILEWFGSRPGVEAEAIEESEFGGVPSRRRTVRFGSFDGGEPCSPGVDSVCHWLVGANPTGMAVTAYVGDALDVHELTVGGHRLLVMIDETYDPTNAALIAESVSFEVVAHPAAPSGSKPLPFAGPLAAGTTYVSEKSSGGLWLVDGIDGIRVERGLIRDRFVVFSADDARCLSITDASDGLWYGSVAEPDGRVTGGQPMNQDLVDLLARSPGLEIVSGPTEVPFGDAIGIATDVRPVEAEDVVLADTSTSALAGQVTRVIAVPRQDSWGADLVVVTAGSPCDALLDGLVFIAGAER